MIPSLKPTWHLKIDPGKGDSCWKPSVLGDMLVSWRLTQMKCKKSIEKYPVVKVDGATPLPSSVD